MRKIYIKLSYNTDMRSRQTEVEKIPISVWKQRIKRNAIIQKDEFAFPGAADESLPGYQQNWHHRLTKYYFLEVSEFNQLVKRLNRNTRMNIIIGGVVCIALVDGKNI